MAVRLRPVGVLGPVHCNARVLELVWYALVLVRGRRHGRLRTRLRLLWRCPAQLEEAPGTREQQLLLSLLAQRLQLLALHPLRAAQVSQLVLVRLLLSHAVSSCSALLGPLNTCQSLEARLVLPCCQMRSLLLPQLHGFLAATRSLPLGNYERGRQPRLLLAMSNSRA